MEIIFSFAARLTKRCCGGKTKRQKRTGEIHNEAKAVNLSQKYQFQAVPRSAGVGALPDRLYGEAFVLYLTGVWTPTLTGIALLFGLGMAFDSVVSLAAYLHLRKRRD